MYYDNNFLSLLNLLMLAKPLFLEKQEAYRPVTDTQN